MPPTPFPLVLCGLIGMTAAMPSSAIAQSSQTTTTDHKNVCNLVRSMPSAQDTDTLLSTLETNREQMLQDLEKMRMNMERYDAEKYGWQNIIDSSGADSPKPGAWLLGAVSMACEQHERAAVTGTVRYPQRIALPPDAILVVRLEDVSRADAPATVLSEERIETKGQQVPFPFKLPYNPEEIQSRHRYSVRAQIFYGDQLAWTSTTVYPVITQGNPVEIDVQLKQVTAREPSLLSALKASKWRLVALGESSSLVPETEATLTFLEGDRIAGNTGCNQFFGTYQLMGDALSISPTGKTSRGCSSAMMAQETTYLSGLTTVSSIRLKGTQLDLLNADGQTILRFVSDAAS